MKVLTQKNYTNYLIDAKKDLIAYSVKKENQIKKFKDRLEVVNVKTNSLVHIKHDPLAQSKDNYLWFVYNQKLLEEKMTNEGNYTTLFITLTLPSQYHKYSSHTKKYNPNYNKKNTINKGYQVLNKAFRTIYKNFRVNRKAQKIFFSKVIEPHKDLTPHLHAIIYVKSEHLAKFKKHILNTIKLHALGRNDIEEINDITRSTSYLLKYIQKNTNPQDEKDFHFFNGWKKQHKIRVFTHSNLELERYIFKKVNSVLSLSKGLENKNPITEVLENCSISVDTKDRFTKEIKTKTYERNSDARYEVVIKRTRTKFVKKETYSKFVGMSYFEAKRLNIKLHEREVKGLAIYANIPFTLSEVIYTYKIDSFTIIDTQTDETLYSKKDFMLLDDFKYSKYLKGENFVLEYI